MKSSYLRALLTLVSGFIVQLSSVSAQSCAGCTSSYDSDTSDEIHVVTGTVCIGSNVVCSGNVFLEGGVLCNHGTISSLIMSNCQGIILNYGQISAPGDVIDIPQDLTIHNFPRSSFEFPDNETTSLGVNIAPSATLRLKVYNQATLTTSNHFNFGDGKVYLDNGVVWDEEPSNTNVATISLGNVTCDLTNFYFFNYGTGITTINGVLELKNTGDKSIVNEGTFTVDNDLSISGDGSGLSSVTIENSGTVNILSDLIVDYSHGSVVINNNNVSGDQLISVAGSVTLSCESGAIGNYDFFSVGGNVVLNSGSIFNYNNSMSVAYSLFANGGTFENSFTFSAKDVSVGSGGNFTNNGYISLTNGFTNRGTTSLIKRSYVYTPSFYNISGSITGGTLTSTEQEQNRQARVVISGVSQNTSTIGGYLLIEDQSLNCSTAPTGYGFDVLTNTASVGSNVLFVNVCTEDGPSTNCASLNYSLSANSSHTVPICPWGFPTNLSGVLNRVSVTGSSSYSTPVPGATYVWQPGNMSGQNITVNPTVTTTYTLYATANGCVFTQTVTVLISPVSAPTISYTTSPFSPTATVNFPVTQTGQTGGVYSIAPSHPSVSINPSTGQITATGNCFGTYTVTYHTSPFNPEAGVICEDYYATTIVVLENFDCPFSVPVPSYTLCPEDKVELFISGGYGQYTWTPAPTTSTAGINCTLCTTPTLTVGDTFTQYTITASKSGTPCGVAHIDIHIKEFCQKEEIIGCCFSNYGASVWLNDQNTYLNIYCNLVNELGYTSILQQGDFKNINGSVRVLLDWIHNAKNDLYLTQQGISDLFGTDQKVKGVSSTHFNYLNLLGNGTKSIWVDEFGHNNLNLTSNVLGLRNNTYLMKNQNSSVLRTTGYASNSTNGYFSWSLGNAAAVTNQKYLYPLGAPATTLNPFRYRPLVAANNSTSQADEISANFMNMAPSLATDPVFTNVNPLVTNTVTSQAPNVLQINNAFYHKVKHTSTLTTVSDLSLKSYYSPIDGQFQSISEWEKDPAQTTDWWGSTPGSSSSNSTSGDAGTLGLIYAMANGTLNFNHTPFTLARGGFYINTNSFGNSSGNGNGTIITVTASTSSVGATPSGGGLNNPFGTGGSSGNNGNGGSTVFTPNPVAGEYVISITPGNNCAIPGKIKFVIDQNGNISPQDVKYGLASAAAGAYLGELSTELFTIDNLNTGITLNSNPSAILKNCVNSVTVTTSSNGDFVLSNTVTPAENLLVYLPSASVNNTITYGQFKIYNSASLLVFSSASNLTSGTNTLNPLPLAAGVYRFEFLISASAAPPITEMIKGQLIIK